MRKRLFIVLIFILIALIFVDQVDSRRLGNRQKDKKEKKEKKDEKNDADAEEEDISEDLKNLDANATLSCYQCSSDKCTETLKTCEPGDICWKGKTIDGLYKGCASRLCNPVDTYPNVSIFTSNICCIKDNCNNAYKISSLNFLLIFSFIQVLI